MVKKLRVAVAQCRTQPDSSATISLLERITREASAKGVGLLLFPEAFIGGYPRSATFGSSIGKRADFGREQFLGYHNDAADLGDTPSGAYLNWIDRKLPIPEGRKFRGDGTREELERIARETDTFLVVGVVEKAASSLYCTSLFVSGDKGIVAKRRKVMPTGTERLVWSQGSTDTLKAVRVDIKGQSVILGSAICWENYMPLLRYSLYAQAVDIWLAPTADSRDTWLPLMQTIASEGRCFVLSSNQVVRRKHLPDWVTANQPGQMDSSLTNGSGSGTGTGTRLRRASTIQKTESGHEICWPEISPASVSTSNTEPPIIPLGRRKSTVIKSVNGVELCLPAIPDQDTAKSVDNDTDSQMDGYSIAPDDTHSPQRQFKSNPSSSIGLTEEENATLSEEFVSRGGSCILSPFGKVLDGPVFETDCLLISDIDLDDCVRGKLDFDVAGHYSRSDSFKLTVHGLELSPP
jgi:nitrilase